MNTKLQKKCEQGYDLDFGKVMDLSIDLFKKTAGLSGVVAILMILVVVVLYFAFFALHYDFSDIERGFKQIENDANNLNSQVINSIFGMLINSLTAPLIAGFLYVNHLAKNNQPIQIGAYFQFYSNNKFKDLVLNQLIISFIVSALSVFFVLQGHNFISVVFQLIMVLYTFYTVPLIIFDNQTAIQALAISPKLFLKQPFLILFAVIVGIIGALVGLIALCVGVFFTLSYFHSITYATYFEGIGFEDEQNSINEIGMDSFKD